MLVRHPAYFGKQEPSTQMAWAFSVASCILLEVVLVQCVGYKDAVDPFCLEPPAPSNLHMACTCMGADDTEPVDCRHEPGEAGPPAVPARLYAHEHIV